MFDKILSGLKSGTLKTLRKTAKMRITGLSLLLIRTIIVLIILAILLYFWGWLFNCMKKGAADLPAMNELIKTLTGTSFIAAIGFLGKALLDEDGDGESDACQNKEDDK